MPISEANTNVFLVQLLLNGRWSEQLGEGVQIRRDAVLVVALGEQRLLQIFTGVIYAIQTRPWFREIHLWQSFINVDLEFLKRLEKDWCGEDEVQAQSSAQAFMLVLSREN